MSGFTVEIKDEGVAAALTRVAAAVGDMSPLMDELGALVTDSIDERFRTGTAVDGTPFAPRSPVTLAAYARRGDKPGPHPLIGASRRLSTTIHYNSGPDHFQVGSAAVQAAVMQFGAAKGAFGKRVPWGAIPARPFLGLSDDDRFAILAEVDAWLQRAIGKA